MDSSVSPTHGEQEMSVWNGHYACTCYHPLFVFNQFGDLETLRPATSAGVRRSMVMRSEQQIGGVRPYVRENRQMRPSNAVRTVWNAGAIDTSQGLPANPEDRYHPRQFGVHPGNPG
jgi:hypothetical protein